MENDCRFLSYADDYVHGDLEGRTLAEFQFHLASCEACAHEVETLKDVKDSLNLAHDLALDERFTYSVVNELRNGAEGETSREIRIAIEDIIVSFATLLVIVLIGIQLFHKPAMSTVDMVGKLSKIEQSSLDQTALSNDQVLELVMRNK